jgi:hypothetical protein
MIYQQNKIIDIKKKTGVVIKSAFWTVFELALESAN